MVFVQRSHYIINFLKTAFEVIVIGAGHAGVEAATASARMGVKTGLITQNFSDIGQMSCNPSIGGIGKSHLISEVDAMGGCIARACEFAAIQLRILNSRKGPAVRATRAQADRKLFAQAMQSIVQQYENLTVVSAKVIDLIISNTKVTGVIVDGGDKLSATSIVLATGTFLGGKLFIGRESQSGGRLGDQASNRLAKKLRELPLQIGRLKTGTPPRLLAKSLNYSLMQVQPGDSPEPVMSFMGSIEEHPKQVNCHLTRTTEKTHNIIRKYLEQSPMFSGDIEGVGPRYCPSIEDKITRFADKDSHQIFVEPEGLDNPLIYPNGISTSLPKQAQLEFVSSIVGFENAKIENWGYAIEYDFMQPQGLKLSLESKFLSGLFLAGQINGTTGYEEAAAQGLIAGINAAQNVKNASPITLGRDQAYIGVMIDDLITLGTNEPYRMFTSRAEYRLNLRQDNAIARLTPLARKLGLVSTEFWQKFQRQQQAVATEIARLKTSYIHPNTAEAVALNKMTGVNLSREYSQYDLLKRPELKHSNLSILSNVKCDARVGDTVEIQVKYQGYLARQQQEIDLLKRNENTVIPLEFNYQHLPGLSNEVVQKLSTVRPETLGQASRIPGVTPVAVSLLSVYLKRPFA